MGNTTKELQDQDYNLKFCLFYCPLLYFLEQFTKSVYNSNMVKENTSSSLNDGKLTENKH